jgi:hypothetical protein
VLHHAPYQSPLVAKIIMWFIYVNDVATDVLDLSQLTIEIIGTLQTRGRDGTERQLFYADLVSKIVLRGSHS